jgi:hypothetical protein
LNLEHCSKWALIRHMASQAEDDDAMIPQQKSSLQVFTGAFNEVFKEEEITLRDVLKVDKPVSTVVSSEKLKRHINSKLAQDRQ